MPQLCYTNDENTDLCLTGSFIFFDDLSCVLPRKDLWMTTARQTQVWGHNDSMVRGQANSGSLVHEGHHGRRHASCNTWVTLQCIAHGTQRHVALWAVGNHGWEIPASKYCETFTRHFARQCLIYCRSVIGDHSKLILLLAPTSVALLTRDNGGRRR